jgi:hypothetical protein
MGVPTAILINMDLPASQKPFEGSNPSLAANNFLSIPPFSAAACLATANSGQVATWEPTPLS